MSYIYVSYKEYQKQLQESQEVIGKIKKEFQNPETMKTVIEMTKKSYDLMWSHKRFPEVVISMLEIAESFLTEVQTRPIFRLLDGIARFTEGVQSLFGFELKPNKKLIRRLFPQTIKRIGKMMAIMTAMNTQMAEELSKAPEFQKYMETFEKLADRF